MARQGSTNSGRSPVNDFTLTERTQVHRLPKRGVYEREAVYRILDEGLVCHVGFVADGKPVVIPTGYGRKATCSTSTAHPPAGCFAPWARV